MKKILIGTSALVAAGMIAAPSAMAAEKINLGLGGFMSQYAGYATQEDSYEKATSASYARFDVKGNTEIYVQGSTKLDNGLTVGAQVQMEADRRASGTTDWTYLYVSSAEMGTVYLGEVGHAYTLMMHNAPEAGNSVNWGQTNTVREFISQPGAVEAFAFPFDAEDDAAISYLSPSFAGFKFGATFTPSHTTTALGNTASYSTNANGGNESLWSVGIAYDGDFDGVKFGVDYAHEEVDDNGTSSLAALGLTAGTGLYNQDRDYDRFGASVSAAGFTVGGSYMRADFKHPNTSGAVTWDGRMWEAGVMYKTGPYGVSLSYFNSKVEGTAPTTTVTAGDDTMTILNLGGSYTMGPGVDLRASIAKVKYEDETTNLSNNNEGWTAHAGVSLAF